MKAMFQKELRQWWKLGLAFALAHGLMHAACLNQNLIRFPADSGSYGQETRNLLTVWYQAALAFGAGLTALVLGMVQWLPETARDQWAFLMHRPVSRLGLFLGKSVAGLLIYFAAVVVPWIAAAAWTATPGNLASVFEWRMLLPGIVDLLGGWTFYCAGVVVSLRQTRWLGSRALPVFGALLFVGLAAAVGTFQQAIVIVVVGLFASVLTAWIAFRYAADEHEAPTVLGWVQGAYFSSACILPLWTGVAFVTFLFTRTEIREWQGESYFMRNSGELVIGRFHNGQLRAVVGSNGVETAIPSIAEFHAGVRPGAALTLRPRGKADFEAASYRSAASFYAVFEPQSGGAPNGERWFYQVSTGRIHGYHTKDRLYLGSIGPQGFVEAGQPVPEGDGFRDFDLRLMGPGWRQHLVWMGVLVAADTVYHVEPSMRRVQTELTVPKLDQLTVFHAADAGRWVIAHSPGRLHLKGIGQESSLEVPVQIPESENCNVWVYVDLNQDRIDVVTQPLGAQTTLSSVHNAYDLRGTLQRTTVVPPLSQVGNNPQPRSIVLVQAAFVPPLLHLSARWDNVEKEEPVAAILKYLMGPICAGVLALFCRVAGGASRLRWFWILAGLGMGIVAVLAYVALRHEETKVRCGRCGRDHAIGLDCGGDARPEDDGTTIFADLSEQQS